MPDDEDFRPYNCNKCGAEFAVGGTNTVSRCPCCGSDDVCYGVRTEDGYLVCPKCGAGVSDCATFGCGADPSEVPLTLSLRRE